MPTHKITELTGENMGKLAEELQERFGHTFSAFLVRPNDVIICSEGVEEKVWNWWKDKHCKGFK